MLTVRFTDTTTVEVDGTRLTGRHVLIATGAKPRPLEFTGAEHVIASDEFLELNELPSRILFVGGGYISFEFAHIAARAGSQVQIIDRGTRPLSGFDPDLVDKLVARSRSAGIDMQFGAAVTSVTRADGELRVSADLDGERKEWSVDLVVHGAGRVPAIDRLNLEAAGVDSISAGIVVNEYLQSLSNPVVYAAGDAAASPGTPLTPVAVFEGKVAASNMLKGNHTVPDYRGVPSTVFTIPELARVGMLEAEAKKQNPNIRVAFNDTSGWYSNIRIGEPCAATKVIVDEDTDEILGAHLLGPEYSELINIFALAIRLKLKTVDLKQMVSAYPSVGSDLGSML